MRRLLAAALMVALAAAGALATVAAASCGETSFNSPIEGYGPGNPGAPSIAPTCTGDPINCATGNLTLTHTDIAIGGRGPGLQMTRSYNSQAAAQATESGPFGYGWSGPYSSHLEINEETGTVVVHHDNGSGIVFFLAEGKYTGAPWVQSTLATTEENYAYALPDQTELEFDSTGLLIAQTDRNGNSLSFEYDEEGRLKAAVDDAERQLTFAYNEEGQIESVTDPMENEAEYAYESGHLTEVTLPGDESPRWEFGYDEETHELTSLTDGRGNTTTTEYDGSNRAILQIDAEERERSLEYEAISGGSQTTITEPNESVTVQKFNELGQLTSVTRASGTELAATTTKKYDSAFNLIEVTDPNEHATKFGYDEAGNLISEKDSNGNETKWTYNGTHDVVSVTNPKEEKITLVRDAAGNIETIKRPAPEEKTQESTFEYTSSGDLKKAIDPLERATTFEYDEFGNLEVSTNAAGETRTWTYNENSVMTSEVSPRGNEEGAEPEDFTTEIEPDAQGRPRVVTDPLNNTTELTFDDNSNLKTQTDAHNHTVIYTYNDVDELVEVERPDETTITSVLDSMGQLVSRTDGNEETTEYERDLLGRVVKETDPLERVTEKAYDDAGNLEEVVDAEERVITYQYDPANRLVEVDFSGETPDIDYEYDANDNVVAMEDGSGTSEWEFDQLGRLTKAENGNEDVVEYGYDLADQQTTVVYPNEKSIIRAFDEAGRLEKVTDWLEGETEFSYNADSLLETTTFPGETGNIDEYEYDNAGRMSGVSMLKGEEVLASLTYARDGGGQVETVTQTGLPGAAEVEYAYDPNDRIEEAGATAYGYDAANNPTLIGEDTFSYDDASQLESGGGASFDFNDVGERTEMAPEAGPATDYGYDQAGNLISVDRPEGGEVEEIEETYGYDGTGLRISETDPGGTRHLTWDLSVAVPPLLNDGKNSYIYGPDGMPIIQIDTEEEPLYLHHDQLGSTRMLTGATGSKEGAYSFNAYGNIEEHTGSATTPLGFNGQYTSESTGLIYLRARAYDPGTAQFASVDPLVGQTGEPYGYAANNPINLSDPSGEATQGYCVSFAGVAGALAGGVMLCLIKDGKGRVGFTLTGGVVGGADKDGIVKALKEFAKDPLQTIRKMKGSVAAAYQSSNACNVADLEGWATAIQGAIAIPTPWVVAGMAGYEHFESGNIVGNTYSLGAAWPNKLDVGVGGGRQFTGVMMLEKGSVEEIAGWLLINHLNFTNPFWWAGY